MLKEYVVDTAELPWKEGSTLGVTFRGQVLLSGDDGGPEAFRFRFDPCLVVEAHMHLVSQFQLLLGGTMDLPKATMSLRPVGVFYTDLNRPYGPFAVDGPHEVLVLHPRKGGIVTMSDREFRKGIHLGGREYSGREHDVDWMPLADGVRYKQLIPRAFGPEVLLFDFPPDTPIALSPPMWGRYEVVLQGAVVVDGRTLAPPGLRYVIGDEEPSNLTTGPAGATIIFLSFDADALEGGLGEDAMSVAGAEAMARAI